MKEKWKPLCETPNVSTYQHRGTTVIFGEKEITFQTSKKMRKIKRNSINNPQDKQNKKSTL